MKFIIEGKPTGKGRPKWGKYSTYTPQKTIDYENLVKFSYLQVTNDKLVDCPIKIKIKAYFEPPKSTSKKKYKELMGQPYTKKPDIDNICKSILDGLNGIAYTDDNQVAELEVEKIYSDKARTEVEIIKLQSNKQMQ